jgi:heme a synthase
MSSKNGLHIYAVVTSVATLCLLIAGGLVTSTGSGLAVPDWPLSFGTLFPPMTGGIRYEHSHRIIAGIVGLMVFALAVGLARSEARPFVKRLGFITLSAVVIQALLGGMTVLLKLPPQISIAHAMLGQIVFCLVVCIAWCTRNEWPAVTIKPPAGSEGPLRLISTATVLAVFVQLFLGAVIRHTGYAVMMHIACALIVFLLSVICLSLSASARTLKPALFRFASNLFGLVIIQIGFGFTVFFNRGSVNLRTAHVVIAALVLAQAVILAWDVRRRTQLQQAPQPE